MSNHNTIIDETTVHLWEVSAVSPRTGQRRIVDLFEGNLVDAAKRVSSAVEEYPGEHLYLQKA